MFLFSGAHTRNADAGNTGAGSSGSSGVVARLRGH